MQLLYMAIDSPQSESKARRPDEQKYTVSVIPLVTPRQRRKRRGSRLLPRERTLPELRKRRSCERILLVHGATLKERASERTKLRVGSIY